MKIFGRLWVIGAVVGLIFATIIAVVSLTAVVENTGFEGVRNFFSGLPVLLAWKLWPGKPDLFVAVMLFVYWIAVGALVGWCIGKGKAVKIGVATLVLILVFGHFLARLLIDSELEGVARTFANFVRVITQ